MAILIVWFYLGLFWLFVIVASLWKVRTRTRKGRKAMYTVALGAAEALLIWASSYIPFLATFVYGPVMFIFALAYVSVCGCIGVDPGIIGK